MGSSSVRKYGTCFFERYAKISLESLLGEEFADLVNEDRPDLQSPDGISIGIEVTRAMEESKDAARSLLKEMAGIVPMDEDRGDLLQIIGSGYGFGLQGGKYIGSQELNYWTMALPMKRILETKISKLSCGLYGDFRKMGLYVFCKDNLSELDVKKTCRFALDAQSCTDRGYDRLYLCEVSCLHVCNLSDGIGDNARVLSIPIPQDLRKEFYLDALWGQFEG